MKFLCLHGAGTNADILQSQLAPLYNALGKESSAEFHFVEGECEATPVEGISEYYDGPYLSFYPWPPRMDEAEYNDARERAYELIYEAIEEEGPFDAILGFSQGASLAYLFLQQHARKNPFDPPWSLFRCAVFICGMPPFRIQENSSSAPRELSVAQAQPLDAQELSDCLSELALNPSSPDSEDSAGSDAGDDPTDDVFSKAASSASSPASSFGTIDPNNENFTLESEDFDLVFDEDFSALKIPSVHVGGKSDKVYDLTRKLYSGMNRDNTLWIEHELGHTIPWDKANTQQFVDIIRELERKTVLS